MTKRLPTRWEHKGNRVVGVDKVTIESTEKKLYGTLVWKDENGKYYCVERYRHLGITTEMAHPYGLTKEEFEAL